MRYPAWLGNLTKRDEALRRANGLYPAPDGWYKTINLKKRYIGKPMPLADVLAVLPARIAEVKNQAGESPRRLASHTTSIESLVEMFVAHLWQRHLTGTPRKMERRTYDDYVDVLARFVECVGPTTPAMLAGPDWFTKYSRTIAGKAVSTRRREFIYLSAFFNWAGPGRHALNFYKVPVNFGPDFVKPDESALRTSLAASTKLYSVQDYVAAMTAVKDCPLLWAVGLLGLNAAYLPSDITALTDDFVNLDTGVIEYPRGKTGIGRKVVLLPQTIDALRRYIAIRKRRPEAEKFVFVTEESGLPFNRRKGHGPDAVGRHNNTIGIYWNFITGFPLSGLRTTFATNADGFPDDNAIDVVMGHAAKTIRARHYVKHFEPSRLSAVVRHAVSQYVERLPQPGPASFSAAELVRAEEARRSATPSKPQSTKRESDSGRSSNRVGSRRGPATRPTGSDE